MDHDEPDMSNDQPTTTPDGPRIALFGLGTVGTAVAQRLLDPEWQSNIAARGHRVPQLVAVADLDLERDRGLDLSDIRAVTDFTELIEAEDIDIVIELMGGSGVAGDAVVAALRAGKGVVTANKDLVARRGRELEDAARDSGSSLRFEAAVLAGVPVLGPLVRELGSDHFSAVRGIFNGTTNYILSTMASDARDYADVLAEAQARGYAEADPTSDVAGFDAAYKLTILSRLMFGGWPDVDALQRTVPSFGGDASEGISGVQRSHLGTAARLGMVIKLISRAERASDTVVTGAITPMALAAGSELGSTGGVTNVVEFTADPIGRVSMAGPGAGGPATSTAILSDVLALDKAAGSTWGQLPPAGELEVQDDLLDERGWLVIIEGLGLMGFPDAVKDMALATTDEGFVSKPTTLIAMTARLGMLDRPISVYPVLADA